MKAFVLLMPPRHISRLLFVTLLGFALVSSAIAQPSKAARSSATKIGVVSGVDTIKPKETEDKISSDEGGWSGAYVGINAGAGFGTTAGTNWVAPSGTAGRPEKEGAFGPARASSARVQF